MNPLDLPLPAHIKFIRYSDAKAQTQALAVDVGQRLDSAIACQGRALLRVSGGRSPVPLFEALARQPLAWQQVLIALVDERWCDGSNEQLVRRYLQQGLAAQACVLSLRAPGHTLELCAQWAARCQRGLPAADVLLLGMGDDGHCASLFAGSANLPAALQADAPWVSAQWAPVAPQQRLSLSVPAILSAKQRLLVIQGQSKLETLSRALQGDDAQALPIRALLNAPLEIHWCP